MANASTETVAQVWGMICPKCQRDDKIRIHATIEVSLHPDGTEPIDSNTEWDNASIANCNHCDHTNTVRDFEDAYWKSIKDVS